VYLAGQRIAEDHWDCGTNTHTVSYYHADALGSPVATTDAARNVLERTYYAPYGEALNRTVDGPGYTGHVMDAATGLVYAQQRYYDPVVGKFLSVDPVVADPSNGSNFNRYWYANDNPYRFTDPSGRVGEFVAFRLVLAGAAADAATPDPTDAAAPAKAAVYASALLGTAIGGAISLAINAATNESASDGAAEAADAAGEGAPSGECANCGGETTSNVGAISSSSGMSPRQVKEAIHGAKTNLPKSTEKRNPDVEVCTTCGEVFPQSTDGTLGDSIGNIHDEVDRQ